MPTLGTSLLDLSVEALRLVNSIRDARSHGAPSVLDRLGWSQPRSSPPGPIVWLAAGALAAGAAVLLLQFERARRQSSTGVDRPVHPPDSGPAATTPNAPWPRVGDTAAR